MTAWVERVRISGSRLETAARAAMGTAASGGRGAVAAGALESSNVDLAEEFVGLIQHQRSFSANSRTHHHCGRDASGTDQHQAIAVLDR